MPKQFSIDPKRLRANPWNANFLTPENERKLAASIEKIGYFKPLIVRELRDEDTDTDYEILGGEHRWQDALAKGIEQVDVYNVGVIDNIKAREITVADNARYGTDDTIALANLLSEIGSPEDIQKFLPYTDADVTAIFSTQDIALDELDLPEGFDEDAKKVEEPRPEKTPKTHTIMRFKVGLSDAERITELLTKTQKRQGYSASDELTNAGDALVHQLFGAS